MFLFYSILILAFSGGVFLWSPAGAIIYKISILLVCAMAFLVRPNYRFPKKFLPMMAVLLLNFLYSFLGGGLASGDMLGALFVSQFYFILFILFVVIAGIDVNFRETKRLKFFLVSLIVVQFVFAVIKWFILGKIDEGFLIGTMSHNAGQLSFLFPAVFIPIVFFIYYNKNPVVGLLLVGVLFVFSVLNEKRSIVFLGPLICLASYFSISENKISFRGGLNTLFLGVVFVGASLVFSSFIPSLSGAEGNIKADGRLDYLFTYASEYLFADYGGALQGAEEVAAFNDNVQLGRMILWLAILDKLANADILTLLFGHGAGYITPSSWVNSADVMFDRLGYRGAVSGAGIALVEGGLVGFFLNISIFFVFYFEVFVNSRRLINPQLRALNRIVFVASLVFLYDYFLYSIVLFRTFPMPVIFLFSYFSLVVMKRYDYTSIKTWGGRLK